MSFSIGDTVDTYRILEEVGRGGMGRVYKVEHMLTRRLEAMKVLAGGRPDAPGQAARSIREIQVQARLDHPNIAGVHNAFWVGEDLILVMELIEGCSLRSVLEAGRVPLATALDYTCQALAALGCAHAHGVIHRDVSPSNMMVTHKGVLKLTDFGLSKGASDAQLSQPGAPIGSLYYMSPEQVRGTAAGEPSDIYSLGAVLYELATGRHPFDGESAFLVMAAQVEQQPVPPIQIEPGLPPLLNEAILRSLAKDPAERFRSADEFRDALLQIDPQEVASASNRRAASMLKPIQMLKPDTAALRQIFAWPRLNLANFAIPRFTLPRFTLPKLALPVFAQPRSRVVAAATGLAVLTAGFAQFQVGQPNLAANPTAPVATVAPAPRVAAPLSTPPLVAPAPTIESPSQVYNEVQQPAAPAAPASEPAIAATPKTSAPSSRAVVDKSPKKSAAAASIAQQLVSTPTITHSSMNVQPVEEKPVTPTLEPPPSLQLEDHHVTPPAEALAHAPVLPETDPTVKNEPAGVKKGFGKLWRIMRGKKNASSDSSATTPPEHP